MIMDSMKDFFGYVKDNYISARDAARARYGGLKDATSSIARNLEDTVKSTDRTIDKIYYESSGLKGIFDDVYAGAEKIYSNMQRMGEDVGAIEDILSGKVQYVKTRTRDKTSSTSKPKGLSRPSRFKSAAMATAAGVGTIKGVYNILRNDNNRNVYRDTSEKSSRQDYPYSSKKLGQLIDIKNKYFWKDTGQLQDIVEKELSIKDDVASLLKDTMRLKVTDERYASLPKLNYDSRIAPKSMIDEMLELYVSSERSLKDISSSLEKKYGMGVSVSTISRNARKYLENKGYMCKNRNEARKIKIRP